jgi:membrane-associated protein
MHIEAWLLTLSLTLAYTVYFAIIFAESGLLLGAFLPGDSFLFTLGLFASQDKLSLPILIGLGIVAAISGDTLGYKLGYRFGPSLFSSKGNRRFFNEKSLKKAEAYFAEHGAKTIVIARFTPVVRSITPMVAGISKMPYRTFLAYNIIGGIGWVSSLTLLGYFLGKTIPNIETYIIPLVAGVILLSLLPAILEYLKARKHRESNSIV